MGTKFIPGDKIKYKDKEWIVDSATDHRYSLNAFDSSVQFSARTFKVDKSAETIELVPRKKKIEKTTKVLDKENRKDSKWWKFW